MIDVAIAGGGIAGSALAIMLGRAGFFVSLFERGEFPRERPCGEGIMPAGVAALERLGLAGATGGAPIEGVRYHAGSTVAQARFPATACVPATGRGQRRLVLDRVLFDAAAATPGVNARTQAVVEAPIVEQGAVRGLVVSGTPVRARLVVAADGARSPLRRALGLEAPRPRRYRAGIRTHFRLASAREADRWIEVFLGRGYELYVTPLENREVLVAALAERPALTGSAQSSFARWIAEQPALAARLGGAQRLTPFLGRAPLASGARRGFAPGAVLIGDAAGFIDPITGGGISQALLSAELLARHAPRILSGGTAALSDFDRDRRRLLRDYELLTRLLLGLATHHQVATATVALMRACPALFSHLIGVAAGTRALLPAGRLMRRRLTAQESARPSGTRANVP